jgi:hypothetical protein
VIRHLTNLQNGGASMSAIKWRVIHPQAVEVLPNSAQTGLQVADAAAGCLEKAIELSHHSVTEHRYIKQWRFRHYHRNGKYDGYGIKVFPGWPDDDPFSVPGSRQHWRRHFP